MKSFIQIIVNKKQEKDYRAFLRCADSKGDEWSLRGYGVTPKESVETVMRRFEENEENWGLFGEEQ